MKDFIKTILEWTIMVAVCYVLVELGIFSCVAKIMGVIAYLGIGCLISLFAADQPNPWLEKRPVLLTIVHIAIAVFWLPIAILLMVWGVIIFVLELFGIRLEKE